MINFALGETASIKDPIPGVSLKSYRSPNLKNLTLRIAPKKLALTSVEHAQKDKDKEGVRIFALAFQRLCFVFTNGEISVKN